MSIHETALSLRVDLLDRYDGDDERATVWLTNVAAATAHLVGLESDWRTGALDRDGRACHATLTRNLSGCLPLLANMLNDQAEGCITVALVRTFLELAFDRAGQTAQIGHA